MRLAGGGQHRSLINGTRRNLHTAYHLHNFFGSLEVLRFKYRTYAEKLEGAEDRPLAGMHDDLSLAVSCVRGEQNPGTVRRVMGGHASSMGDMFTKRATLSLFEGAGPPLVDVRC